MNGGAGGPSWVSFPGQPEGPLTLAASFGGGVLSAKPLVRCRGQELRGCHGRGLFLHHRGENEAREWRG